MAKTSGSGSGRSDLGVALATAAAQIDAHLTAILADRRQGLEIARPKLLMAGMRHAALAGGKRLRPFLMMQTSALFGLAPESVVQAATALELVHCYSLVHDDLPAMDDDDLRRGQPTLHKLHDDAFAILAGDAMLTLAFGLLADRRAASSMRVRLALVRILAQTAGIGGMVGGQFFDLAAEGRYAGRMRRPKTAADVSRIQAMKTGALIEAACRMGGVIGKADRNETQALVAYAHALGRAFQIKDDLLDVEGDAASLGKAAGKDAGAGKATFVSLHGVEGARSLLASISLEGRAALAPFGDRAATLNALLDYNQARKS
jgi:farnesyl diphosphate synthase